ncbi:MAG: hypothetical protein UR27_C0002G0003 [Candidatus Peregrinibacteria bacterium GW2011_GWA2_33_10]|nr:MAG: hypothetical protein UR27_C0002G0003 [Candidatus Peregrinibacteria bacterium GW2011_GWA2_33_10]KKP41018.1 MAG: hypothetical protein UR30_C0002G0052 [Candidatus Peregrinibacteria bacterium GW2011_GWC2_33_13]OGJ46804.1 MAG: hypothetical protein A2229_01610 [Candidatus Peregrinibacteria bacterium RIFOXYA2_FULL_33_7]
MLSKETLETHYSEYASQPDEWVNNMEKTKRSIVEHIIKTANFEASHEPIKIVVLGASDKRYISVHQRVFSETLKRTINMKTFDLDAEHLGGESNTEIKHDVTQPFPDAPYAIIFSHELMKFLTPEEQFSTITNSYQALEENGLAMHILHEPSIKGTSELREWQNRVNPDELIKKLDEIGIPATKITFNSESDVAWLRETTVIVLQKK